MTAARSGEPAGALLGLLGLATRAGAVVAGTEAVRNSAREGKAYRVILAADTAPTQQAKLRPLLEARRVPHHTCFTQDQLGAAMGRAPVAAVAFTEPGFARRVGELVHAVQERERRSR